ncbi:hypothetical protein [Thiocapsa imhoffii]|nr:hypothetical protein [Thiocapsa imhoffii]
MTESIKVDLLHWDRLANPSLKDQIPREARLFFAARADHQLEPEA